VSLFPLQAVSSFCFDTSEPQNFRKETMPIWKALAALYKDCDGAFETETWMEARFYHDLDFKPLPEAFQELQNHLQKQQVQMPRFGGEDDSRTCVLCFVFCD